MCHYMYTLVIQLKKNNRFLAIILLVYMRIIRFLGLGLGLVNCNVMSNVTFIFTSILLS